MVLQVQPVNWMLNGQFSPDVVAVAASDEGLLRGDGAFEVVRTYHGFPFALEAHLDRLEDSASRLELGFDRRQLLQEILSFLAQLTGPERQVRFLVTRGGNRIICEEPLPCVAPALRLGVEHHTQTPLLAGVKSLSYSANMLAIRRARGRGFDDALLVRPDDVVLECPTTAFLWMIDGQLYSSPLSLGILNSITRRALFGLADGTEREIRLHELMTADVWMVAGTGIEVRPVIELEGIGPSPADDAAFSHLQVRLARHVREQVEVDRQRLIAQAAG